MDTGVIVDIVKQGLLSEDRVDLSALRILKVMFQLGLFENAYVDAANSLAQVGTADALALGLEAQHRSMVLLENKGDLLPLSPETLKKAWLHGVEADAARAAGFEPVAKLAEADVALIRGVTPFTTHPGYFFGSSAHEGPLTLGPGSEDYAAIYNAHAAGVPVVADIYIDRPAVLTNVQPMVAGLLADFGATDSAFLDVVTGKARPEGNLPIELPSSDGEVISQRPDLPSDTQNPLYEAGFGLRYDP